jgi:phytol kinase
MFNEEFLSLSLVIAYLGMLLMIAEGINRIIQPNVELTRKIVHIGSGNVILLAWWLGIPRSVIIQASIVAMITAIASFFLPILPSVNSVGRKSFGTLFYAISIGLLSLLFWNSEHPEYTVIGILIMSWGDGMAALIGKKWGKHIYQIGGNKKSWEGSLTMGIVTFIITSLILLSTLGNMWQIWLMGVVVAICATILETISQLGMDNLTVPLGSAVLCFYLEQILL